MTERIHIDWNCHGNCYECRYWDDEKGCQLQELAEEIGGIIDELNITGIKQILIKLKEQEMR